MILKEDFGNVLEMDKLELYDKEDMGEDLNIKATLNEFFLEGENRILGIECDEISMQTGGEQCVIVIVRNGVTYKISLEGAIYSEMLIDIERIGDHIVNVAENVISAYGE